MLQKLINVLALVSFAGVAAIGVGGYCLYKNKDAIIQDLLPIPDLDLPTPELPGADVAPMPSLPTPSF